MTLSHPPSYLPSLGTALLSALLAAPHRCGTMKALTPAPFTYGTGLPTYLATSSCRSVSNHVDCPVIAYHHASVTGEFRTSPCMSRLVAAPRRMSSSSYGLTVRLRLLSTSPRDDAVTFGFGVLAVSDTDFHRADVAPHRRTHTGESRYRSSLPSARHPWMPAGAGMTM